MRFTFLFLSLQRSMCIALLLYASFYPQSLRAATLQNIPRALMLDDGGYYQGELASARFSKFSATGAVIWSRPFGLVYARPLVGSDGSVYVGSSNGRVYAIKPDGTVLWQNKTRGPILSDPQWGGDQSAVFVVTQNGWVYAFDSAGGEQRWAFDLGFESGVTLAGSPRFAPDFTVLYLSDNRGKLYAVTLPLASDPPAADDPPTGSRPPPDTPPDDSSGSSSDNSSDKPSDTNRSTPVVSWVRAVDEQ